MKTLFHLVSGQNSQVYIVSKFYQPDKNVLFYTEATRKNLPALKEVLKGTEIKEVLIHAFKYPKIRNTIRLLVEEHKRNGNELVFNITGGTKIQSIALYEIARENLCVSAYLNSESHNITELGGDEPRQIPVSGMEIDPTDYLRANGQKTRLVPSPVSPFSGQLIEVLSKHFKEFSKFALSFAALHLGPDSIPVSQEWDRGRAKGTRYALRKGAFHLKLVLDGETLFEATDSPPKPLMEDLSGQWLEKAAFSVIEKNPLFTNPQLNTRIVYATAEDKNEFDILAMLGTDLCLFECKSGGVKASDIDQLVALKRMLGSYTRLFMITYFPPSDAMKERLKENNITWLPFTNLQGALKEISNQNANI